MELNLAQNIIFAFGGKDNIKSVENCITRLRICILDVEKVLNDEYFKNECQAYGVIRMRNEIHLVYGPKVYDIIKEVKKCL